MKLKNILYTVLIGLGLVSIASCSDDNDSNPTLQHPTTFTLNEPALAMNALDLEETSDSIILTWSQPNYGMPLITTYNIQYSTEKVFVNEEATDTTEAYCNYIELDETTTKCRAAVSTEDLNRNLMHMLNITKASEVPDDQVIYFRVGAKTAGTDLIYSNEIMIHVAPYFKALVAADPVIWYLTGSCIGDASWNSDLYKGIIPMYADPAETYDEVSGTGIVKWVGYLTSAGFKFRGSTTDNWATQIGQGDSYGEFSVNNGGSANITVPKDGLYSITLDTKTYTVTMTEYTDEANTYPVCNLSGSFNSWGDTPMNPVHTCNGDNNHDWYLTLDLVAGDEVKVKDNTSSWTHNWGGTLKTLSDGYYAQGTQNGSNFYITEAGTYTVYFNDISGLVRFVRQ